MMNRMVFEAVDRKLRDLMAAPYSLSGGKAVVFGGDFRQVAPVVLRASPAQIKLMCLNASDTVWPHVQTLRLTTNMRTQDEEFAQFLLRVGEGREPTVTFGEQNDYIRIPDRFLFQPKVVTADISPEKLLIQEVFPGYQEMQLLPDFLAERAILSTCNADVDAINDVATALMYSTEERLYRSLDSIPDEEDNVGRYRTEYLNTITVSSLPPHKLTLKIGQPIVLLRNMNQKARPL